jgi:penicillin-binding protein 1A
MEKVYNDSETLITKGSFPRPIRKLSVEIDCDQYDDTSEDSDSVEVEVPVNIVNPDDIR